MKGLTQVKKTAFLILLSLATVFSAIFATFSFSYARADVKEGVSAVEDVVVMEDADDYTFGDSDMTLTAINGKTGMGGGVTSFVSGKGMAWNVVSNNTGSGSTDGHYIAQALNPWGFRVLKDVIFTNPVQLDEDYNALIFRLKLHLSNSDTYCLENGSIQHENLGIWIFGIGDTGVAGEGVLIPFTVTQDEWINFEISGGDALKLADSNGIVKGFTVASGIIYNSKESVFYAGEDSRFTVDSVSKGYRLAKAVKPDRTIVSGNGDWSQSSTANSVAKSINGVTAMGGGVTSFGFSNLMWTGSNTTNSTFAHLKGKTDDTNIVGHVFNGWGFTVSRVMNFVNPVNRADVDGITFRIAAHLSSGNTYGVIGGTPPNGGTGIYFFAPDSDGSDGVLLPYDITQDEWVDFTITGSDLDKLTDKDGKISGFYIGAGIISESSTVLYSYNGTSFSQSAYLLFDSVKFNNQSTVTYKDGETNIKSQDFYTGYAPFFVPEKDGKAFVGWSVNEQGGRLLGYNEEHSLDITTLYTNWVDVGDLTAVKGLYVDGENSIMIFNDGTVRFSEGYGDIHYYAYGSNGILYAFDDDFRIDIDLSSLTKKDSIEVTYLDGEYGEKVFYKTRIETGTIAQNITNESSSFEFWSKELNGTKYGFTDALDSDTVLYAVNRYSLKDKMVATGDKDTTEGGQYLLQSIGGCSSMNDGTAIMSDRTFRFYFRTRTYKDTANPAWAGSDDGNVFGALIGSWGFSLTRPTYFNTPIKVEDYDSITFRVFCHFSPNSPYGGNLWGGAGVRIFGANSDGSDPGVLVPLDIKQDEWVDLTVGKEGLNYLAEDDGYMYGFTIGAALVIDTSKEMGKGAWHTEFDWEKQSIHKSTYLLIDYITLSSEKTLTYKDTDGTDLNTQKFRSGESVQYNYVPQKTGKVFTGWTAYEQPLDYQEIFNQDVKLYANWTDAKNIKLARGLYTKSGHSISIFRDGSVVVDGLDGVISCGLGTDGVLYCATATGVKTYNLSEYSKSMASEVKIEGERYLVASGSTFNVIPKKNGYVIDKIYIGNTQDEFVLGVTTVYDDVVLNVVWAYDQVEDYKDVLGYYYNSSSKTMLQLKENNVALVNGQEKAYYLLKTDEVVIEGAMNGTYNGTYISLDGNYVKLGTFTVQFDAGNGITPPEKQTVSGGSYKATKPADPVQEGYEFVCWLTADGKEFDFDSVITRSTQLFAKWQKVAVETPEEEPLQPPTSSSNDNGNGAMVWIIVSASVVVAGAGTTTTILLIRKKRRIK